MKDLGAYYTPVTLADVLAQWIVRTGCERILEPSVGEGALVDAAVRQARLMHEYPKLCFTVCDINPIVIETIRPQLTDGSEARAVDFLQLDPLSTGPFDAVLANPPFTRNHKIEAKRRSFLRQRFDTLGAAGLWVHFLIHSLEFLRAGGKLAAVVPASALFSDYGRACLQRVSNRFATVELREIVDRPSWTNGADERGALFLADGFGLGLSELPVPQRWTANGRQASNLPAPSDEYDRLAACSQPFGSIALFSIGVVTGNNRIFLIDDAHRALLGIKTDDLVPVVSRARQIPSLTVDRNKLLELAHSGERTWLLAPAQLGEKGSGVRRQLAKIPASRRAATVWFQKRDPWWKVDLGARPDAIFTYMNDRGPRLALATGDVRCTNTLHRVNFKANVTENQRFAASLSLVSTFGQLAAERLGRVYGGGLLKFELKDARRLPILPEQGSLRSAFEQANVYLASGKTVEATRVADEALLAPLLGNKWESTITLLKQEIDARQTLRRGS
ncbi:Eco57I restriction-modification methylase domain-containing protein [Sinorhizobium meliloti]|uniref:Eco57I restriction-modification methylase domain-containing protein n=1 Tax=Rhizobium meliloti TaxID=382 RepID=UPI00398D56AE